LKSGSLNLLEPSGPVQGCNGIALPFLLTLDVMRGEVKCIQDFGGETCGTDHLEDPDEDLMLIK
jgi:hypothetical protein